MISFKCASCGGTLRTTKTDDKHVHCKKCNKSTPVPPVEFIKASCPECSKTIVMQLAQLGQQVKCEHCSKIVTVRPPNKSRGRSVPLKNSDDADALRATIAELNRQSEASILNEALNSLNSPPDPFSPPLRPIKRNPVEVSRLFPIDSSSDLPVFEFKARDKSGDAFEGRIQAKNAVDVAKQLRKNGLFPEPNGIVEFLTTFELEHPADLPRRGAEVGMDSDRSCPFCGESIRRVAKKCKHCGEWLGGTSQATVSPRGIKRAHSNLREIKSSGIAIVLSFFYPGLGHLYAGNIARGLLFMVLPPIVVAVVVFGGVIAILKNADKDHVAPLVIIGMIGVSLFVIVLWVWIMFDAKVQCEDFNGWRRQKSEYS